MKNAEKEGIVLVIIWAVVAVALSFLAEARGNQTTDLMPLNQDAYVQLSTTTVGSTVVGAATTDALGQRTEEITEANWQQHPKIKAIRQIVSSVNAGLKKGIFKSSQRRFEFCDNENFDEVAVRRIAVNSKGVPVWYEQDLRSEDWAFDFHHYYDQVGRLRFVLIFGYGVGGGRRDVRIYFDETGKRIWEDHKFIKSGYGGAWPDVWKADFQKTDPAKAFAEASPCPEIKPKSRRRAR